MKRGLWHPQIKKKGVWMGPVPIKSILWRTCMVAWSKNYPSRPSDLSRRRYSAQMDGRRDTGRCCPCAKEERTAGMQHRPPLRLDSPRVKYAVSTTRKLWSLCSLCLLDELLSSCGISLIHSPGAGRSSPSVRTGRSISHREPTTELSLLGTSEGRGVCVQLGLLD